MHLPVSDTCRPFPSQDRRRGSDSGRRGASYRVQRPVPLPLYFVVLLILYASPLRTKLETLPMPYHARGLVGCRRNPLPAAFEAFIKVGLLPIGSEVLHGNAGGEGQDGGKDEQLSFHGSLTSIGRECVFHSRRPGPSDPSPNLHLRIFLAKQVDAVQRDE